MDRNTSPSRSLSARITRSASKQTYFTIRFFVDRARVAEAYRAYAYFRWVDDCLDTDTFTPTERADFIERQQALLDTCYQGQSLSDVISEEMMLVDLIHNNPERSSGLEVYLRNMMAVMSFDMDRRGRLIMQAELSQYSRLLATAVTEALHYFIGNQCPSPQGEARYLAVRGAHIIHMLRDWQEDVQAGYFNIPAEYVQEHHLQLDQVEDPIFRKWVQSRVHLARACFRRGRETIAQVQNLRCRLAGYAYVARFEWMLHTIETDNFHLHEDYPERKSWQAGLWMLGRTITSSLGLHKPAFKSPKPSIQYLSTDK